MNIGKVATGLTLVELIIGLAILAVLLSLASPSFQRFTNRQIIRHQIWELRRALELARGLAVAQQTIWKVCMATNNHHCVKQGGQRLLVFQDSDNDHRRDATESLHLDLQNSSTIVTLSASGRSYVRFKASGEAMDSGNFLVCGKGGGDYGRKTIVFRSGRVRLSKDTDGDGYDDLRGVKITC
ncbi:MAG: GspH/FimT family pseudopilin [Porticoccaceae bacterium]